MTGLVAATAIAAVLLFFTEPLRYVPVAALGAVLVFAAFSLFDVFSYSIVADLRDSDDPKSKQHGNIL